MMKIEKINPCSREQFYKKYMKPQVPVIIRNLLSNTPVSQYKDLFDVRKIFGNLQIELTDNHYDIFKNQNAVIPDYLNRYKSDIGTFIEKIINSKTRKICADYPSPHYVREMAPPPEICYQNYNDQQIDMPLFIAPIGTVAPMHVDTDLKHVLIYQVFGRKKCILISAEYSHRLLPLMHSSNLEISKFSKRDLSDLIKYTNAYVFDIDPGETLYVPPLMWHELHYVQDSMSITYRFSRNSFAKFMAINDPFKDYLFQKIALIFLQSRNPNHNLRRQFIKIRKALQMQHKSRYDFYVATRRVYKNAFISITGKDVARDISWMNQVYAEKIIKNKITRGHKIVIYYN